VEWNPGCHDRFMLEIYIRLLNEGVDVWWPAEALPEGAGVFRVVGPSPQPSDEEWEFPLGTLVRCERRRLDDGADGLVAVAAVAP
jgi:hypothetical protein